MGAILFLVLFGLGVVLATIGGIAGVVDAFRVSPVWGLLSLFVPFALLVFCIKFWGSRKWAKISLLTTLAGLLSMLAGVPFMAGFVRQQMAGTADPAGDVAMEPSPSDEVPVDQVPIEPPPIDDVAADQVPIEPIPVEGDPNFTTPMVPAAPQLANVARAELIQSTDPDERVRQINSRRADPFATVPIPPPPPPAPPAPPAGGGAGAGQTPGGAATSGGGAGTVPGNRPPEPLPPVALAPLPTLPEPTQALGVVVTGVVTIGNVTYAIVQSPSEPTGRYVAAGQRVADGTVLVKRIDTRGSEPIVVLEENGVELTRAVGIAEEESTESTST
ncbi:MAG: hypothetical protein VKI82_00125 [Leptolyngbya sp.]|nr:hypothetical protein [Leptolyngbya sp.]